MVPSEVGREPDRPMGYKWMDEECRNLHRPWWGTRAKERARHNVPRPGHHSDVRRALTDEGRVGSPDLGPRISDLGPRISDLGPRPSEIGPRSLGQGWGAWSRCGAESGSRVTYGLLLSLTFRLIAKDHRHCPGRGSVTVIVRAEVTLCPSALSTRKVNEKTPAAGMPYTKTGKNGVYDRHDELHRDLLKIGRNRLQEMVQDLLNTGRVQQCAAKGSRVVQWLDLPDGLFTRGEGEFAPGALKGKR